MIRSKMIVGMTKDEILEKEPGYLEIAKASMPSIGIPEIDILVVEEIGKDISGFGMDPNIDRTHRNLKKMTADS